MTRRRRRCGAIHRLISLDRLLRMRSGLAFPVSHGDGRVTLGFENSAVYQDAGDAFAAAQRSIVATLPGAVYRYINSGLNVLGTIMRDQIERMTRQPSAANALAAANPIPRLEPVTKTTLPRRLRSMTQPS
jgi:CubicO group peptidase (beta-lactamase class C family)